DVPANIVQHDLAYPAMLTLLPAGALGLVVASLAAAYMSTISTHLNWGASYVVNDFWKRFVEPDASERRLVAVGRVSTLGLMVLSAVIALWLDNALQAFQILLQIGAGTGLLFILRWFWWRINAFSELTAMVVSFLVAVYLELLHPRVFPAVELSAAVRLVLGVGVTTVAWLVVTYLTRPTEEATLRRFCALVRAGGPGWRAVERRAAAEGEPIAGAGEGWVVPQGILAMLAGTCAVYAALLGTGLVSYGRPVPAALLFAAAVVAAVFLVRIWGRVRREAVGVATH